MANNALQVRIAQTGSVYLAPYGTAAPVDTATPLSATWQQLGYTSDKGVTLKFDVKFGDVTSWQSLSSLRKFVQSQAFTANFELEQTNSAVLSAYFAGASSITNPSESGGQLVNVSNNPGVDERAAVVEFFDGTQKYRVYIPRCIVTDRGDTPLSRTGAVMWVLTIEALAVDANTPIATFIIKDSSYA